MSLASASQRRANLATSQFAEDDSILDCQKFTMSAGRGKFSAVVTNDLGRAGWGFNGCCMSAGGRGSKCRRTGGD
eukprot:723531-Hanusia_phi.AAC.1